MGLGAIVGTGIFVGIGHAASVAGSWVLVAVVIAAAVATLNGMSSAQLAAAHPVSGGTYEYGYRWLHPVFGLVAGWMFLCAKGASAATALQGFAAYALRLLQIDGHGAATGIALAALAGVVAFVLLGVRWSSWLNTLIVTVTLVSLVSFVAVGWFSIRVVPSGPEETTVATWPTATAVSLGGVLEACALMFVAYTGYGRIATLGEEIRHPETNIPRAILVTLGVSMGLYLAVTWVVIHFLDTLAQKGTYAMESTPLEVVAQHLLYPEVRYIVAVGAVTSMLGVSLNLVLGLSRVTLAMGRRCDLPKALSHIDPAGRAPTNAVLFVAGLVGLLILVGDIQLTWSFSAFSVLVYYAITNLAATQMTKEERRYPPALAWMGLVACLFLTCWVELSIWMFGVGFIALIVLWWSRWKRSGGVA